MSAFLRLFSRFGCAFGDGQPPASPAQHPLEETCQRSIAAGQLIQHNTH
jgi:hypothetical protein